MQHLQNNNETLLKEKNEQWFTKAGKLYKNHQKKVTSALETFGSVKKQIFVSGFPITINDKNEAESLREKVIGEAEQSRNLKRKLKNAGITPIAILPENIFDKIIAKTMFYTFYRIQPDGRVYGNGNNIARKYSFRNSAGFIPVFLTLVCLAGPVSILITHSFSNAIFLMSIALALLVIQIAMFVFFITLDAGQQEMKKWQKILTLSVFPVVTIGRYFYYRQRKHKVKSYLWPNKNDIQLQDEDNGKYKGDLFSLRLPQPPERVNLLLEKCHLAGIETFLTIHPKAFEVILDKDIMERLKTRYDPVICTKQNGMVAVLDQFGDFPEEKEVIAYIAEHFNAIRNDLLPLQAN